MNIRRALADHLWPDVFDLRARRAALLAQAETLLVEEQFLLRVAEGAQMPEPSTTTNDAPEDTP